MPRLNPEVKRKIRELSHEELSEIVVKLAGKDQMVHDFVMVNYIDKAEGEMALFDDAIFDLDEIFTIRQKGFAEELRLANMLGACIRRINEFTKVSKNKKLEADLLMKVLDIPFSVSPGRFGSCFTQYDNKVAMILGRMITLVTKKLHEDYRIEYQDKINEYLDILHGASDFNDTVSRLPKSI